MHRGPREPVARLGGRWAYGLHTVTSDLGALDGSGTWAVVIPYDGQPCLLGFDTWSREQPAHRDDLGADAWVGPRADAWSTSMNEEAYCAAVHRTRDAIAAGTVYQANICRILATELAPEAASMAGLHSRLQARNPAPFAGFIDAPEAGIKLATASPELFLRRDGRRVRTGPIKGTAATPAGLLEKDWAENVMIVDLMRNDLGRICEVGSIEVPELTKVEEHPGLVHLVSNVEGNLQGDTGWGQVIDACFPPGSVTGAPKSSALRVISDLEPVSREIYCGAIGWVDADRQQACLAVAIRTFWHRDGVLRFGTGAGITWDSEPAGEWAETQLKARRLIEVASDGSGPHMAGFHG